MKKLLKYSIPAILTALFFAGTAYAVSTFRVYQGGTGQSSIPSGSMIVGNDAQTMTVVAPGASSTVWTMIGTAPGWAVASSTGGGGSGTPASPTNSVQFNNAGSFGGDSNLIWDNTNKRLGIGTSTPQVPLVVVGTTTVTGNFIANSLQDMTASTTNGAQKFPIFMEMGGNSDNVTNGDTQFIIHQHAGFGGAPAVVMYKSEGTFANPTAVLQNDFLGFVGARGYGTSFYGGSANQSPVTATSTRNSDVGIWMFTTQDFTDTAHGTKLQIITTQNNTVGAQRVATFDQSGFFGLNTNTPTALLTVEAIAGQSAPLFLVTSSTRATDFSISPSGRVYINATTTTGDSTTLGFNQLMISPSQTPLATQNGVAEFNNDASNLLNIGAHGANVPSGIIGFNSRGTTASPATTTSGDGLLSLRGAGYSGTFYTSSRARIELQASQTWDLGSNGTQIAFFTTPNNSTTIAERMRLDNAGNLGIGTTTPTNALTVIGSISSSNLTSGNCVQAGAGGLLTTVGSACGSGGGSGNSAWTIGSGLIFNATSTDEVGIGTSTPQAKLVIQSGAGDSQNPLLVVASTSGTSIMQVITQDNSATTSYTYGRVLINENRPFPGDNSKVPDGGLEVGTESANNFILVHSSGGTPGLDLFKSNGTYTSPTNIINGDALGAVTAHGFTNSQWVGSGAVTMVYQAEATWSATNTPSSIIFRTVSQNSTAMSDKVKITANGNVGIGTITPSGILQLDHSFPTSIASSSTSTFDGLLVLHNPAAKATSSYSTVFIGTDDTNGINMMDYVAFEDGGVPKTSSRSATTTLMRWFPFDMLAFGASAGTNIPANRLVANCASSFPGCNHGSDDIYGMTLIGDGALQTAIGPDDGGAQVQEVTAIGNSALGNVRQVSQTVAVGFAAGSVNTALSDDVIIGNDALVIGGSPSFGVYIGHYAGVGTGGLENVYIGEESGYDSGIACCSNTATNGNTFLGAHTGFRWEPGSGLSNAYTNNILIGETPGSWMITGKNNIMIGGGVNDASTTISNMINIQNFLYAKNVTGAFNSADQYAFNASSTAASPGQFGIGTSTPAAKFAVLASSSDANIPIFMLASSTGASMFRVGANGSTTIASLGTGCVGAISGSLYIATTTCASSGGGSTSPGGADTNIQFNNVGAFGGSSNFTYTSSTQTAYLQGRLDMRGYNATSDIFIGPGTGSITGSPGTSNVAIGDSSMGSLGTGGKNIAVGESSLQSIVNTSDSTGLGYRAGAQVDGNRNIFIGSNSSFDQTAGDANIIIGAYIDAVSLSGTAQLNIGNLIYGTGLYNSTNITSLPSAGRIGIGSSTPAAVLGVQSSSTQATLPIFIAASSTKTSIFLVAANSRVGINSSTPNAVLVVQGTGGINATTDILQVSTSTGASLFNISSTGLVGINTTTPSGMLSITSNTTTKVSLIVQAAASQSVDLMQWWDSTGAIKASMATTGVLSILHIAGNSGLPTVATSTGVGAGANTSASLQAGATDLGGLLHWQTANAPAVNATIVTMTFNKSYIAAPFCTLTPGNSTSTVDVAKYFASTTASTLFIKSTVATAITASTTYDVYYHCDGQSGG